MRIRLQSVVAVSLLVTGSRAYAQPLPLPSTRADVRAYDAELVRRVSMLLNAPARWNRVDTGRCPSTATSFSIRCALQATIDSAATAQRPAQAGEPANCHLQRTSTGTEGSCGLLFEELPIFTVSRVNRVTTGRWRDDATPVEVWSGVMTDAAAPVNTEARRSVDAVTTKKHPAGLIDFNNDVATSLAVLRKYLKGLAHQVDKHALADFTEGGDSVEVEIYAGGTGVIRTYNGWYPVTKFAMTNDVIQFQINTAKQVPPNALDQRIVQRAAEILNADSVWNRADDRKCADSAHSWSIYCAMQKATVEVTGGFHHRRPAGELVRVIVEERTKDRKYEHRMMDYNNDKATTLTDVRTLFAEGPAPME